MFGYIRKSKVLELIESERKKLLRKERDILNNIKLERITSNSQKDIDDYIYNSIRLIGGHDSLIDLYILIKEDKI